MNKTLFETKELDFAKKLAEIVADFIFNAFLGDYNFNDDMFDTRGYFFESSVNYVKTYPDSELSKAIKYQGVLYRFQCGEIDDSGFNIVSWSENTDIIYECLEDFDNPVAYISQTEENSFGISVYGLETYLIKNGCSIYDYKDEDALNDSANIIEEEREIIYIIPKQLKGYYDLDSFEKSVRKINRRKKLSGLQL